MQSVKLQAYDCRVDCNAINVNVISAAFNVLCFVATAAYYQKYHKNNCWYVAMHAWDCSNDFFKYFKIEKHQYSSYTDVLDSRTSVTVSHALRMGMTNEDTDNNVHDRKCSNVTSHCQCDVIHRTNTWLMHNCYIVIEFISQYERKLFRFRVATVPLPRSTTFNQASRLLT